MNKIILEVRGIPKAQKRYKYAKSFGHTYDPSQGDKSNLLNVVQDKAPESPIQVPMAVFMTFYLPIPKSMPKYKKELIKSGKYHHGKKPDTENMVKLVLDALEGVFYTNDSLVYFIQSQKIYSETPRTVIIIKWSD